LEGLLIFFRFYLRDGRLVILQSPAAGPWATACTLGRFLGYCPSSHRIDKGYCPTRCPAPGAATPVFPEFARLDRGWLPAFGRLGPDRVVWVSSALGSLFGSAFCLDGFSRVTAAFRSQYRDRWLCRVRRPNKGGLLWCTSSFLIRRGNPL